VSFRYSPDLPDVSDGVDLRIAPGEVVALVGPSGAGKTTIASLLPRFWDVTAGSVSLDGVDVRELSFDDLRGAIGIVPQEPALFSGTIRENIAFAGPKHDGACGSDKRIIAAAKAAHAWEFIQRCQDGLDTRVGERGVKRSGGQRQRLAIARVFLGLPRDRGARRSERPASTRRASAPSRPRWKTCCAGRSTLIIAHRLSTVRRADRVVVLEHGRIIEQGTHDALLAAKRTLCRLYRRARGT
jgi:subfamily B ATP-binding cassette protein MsbA